jgi:hypothetical protein
MGCGLRSVDAIPSGGLIIEYLGELIDSDEVGTFPWFGCVNGVNGVNGVDGVDGVDGVAGVAGVDCVAV